MKTAIILTLLIIAGANMSRPPKKCKTTFIVTDCDNTAVPGSTVKIQLCNGQLIRPVATDMRGQASFAICKHDICKLQVSAVGFALISKSDCSGPDSNTVCKVKLCTTSRPLDDQ